MAEIQKIRIEQLKEHPDNPNRMSKQNFTKLKRHIKNTGRYEPIIVRKLKGKYYQIINGHHRIKALGELGQREADCVVWDLDDHQTDMLLMTLNSLGGKDIVEKKIAILTRLNSKTSLENLSKLLPKTSKQIQALTSFSLPKRPSKVQGPAIASPVVFFLNETQKSTVESALASAISKTRNKTAARAAAIAEISEFFVRNSKQENKGDTNEKLK